MIKGYKVTLLFGLPTTWVTEITHVNEQKYFVNEQRIGPYKLWHHEHILEEHFEETKVIDVVSYQPPSGIFGRLANNILIDRKRNQIFEYRFTKIEELFA